MKLGILAAAALPLLLIAAGGVRGDEPATTSGEALYNRYGCYACHGYVGVGGTMSGPALAGRGFDAKYVFDYARAPKGVMPLYRKSVLPDAELNRIADFVIRLPGARRAAQIPELARLQTRMDKAAPAITRAPAPDTAERTTARTQFASQCASCHGAAGDGGAGPALRGNGKARTAELVAAIIRNPPAGMPRLTPHPIPDADLPALSRYVEELAAGKP